MSFEFVIKDESHLNENNEIFLDEETAIEEALRKDLIVAYY